MVLGEACKPNPGLQEAPRGPNTAQTPSIQTPGNHTRTHYDSNLIIHDEDIEMFGNKSEMIFSKMNTPIHKVMRFYKFV